MYRYYLAYGSNLNLMCMKYRCCNAVAVGKTILEDYQLVYKGYSDTWGYLTVEPLKGSYVPLGIYKVNTNDEIVLDCYEGYPNLYDKKEFVVDINGHRETAFIYIMHSGFSYSLPKQEYIDVCMEGYRDFEFPKEILEYALETTKDKIKGYRKNIKN